MTAQCGSCHAVITWTVTPKGERMPVDAAPTAEGTLILIRQADGEPPLARVLKASLRYGRTDLYLSHFASCPDADKHRKRTQPTSRWLAAGTPADQPYPCRCHSPQGCKRNGRHCPCHGRTDLDHLPLACCARRAAPSEQEHNTHNPARHGSGLQPNS